MTTSKEEEARSLEFESQWWIKIFGGGGEGHWKGWKELEGGQEKNYVIEFLFQSKIKIHQNYS